MVALFLPGLETFAQIRRGCTQDDRVGVWRKNRAPLEPEQVEESLEQAKIASPK